MKKNTDNSAAKPDPMRKVHATLNNALRNSYLAYELAILGAKEKLAEAGGTGPVLK